MRIMRRRNQWRPGPRADVAPAVRDILEDVRANGDDAVIRLTERFDRAQLAPERLAVDLREIEASIGVLEPEVLLALRTAIANVRAVAESQLRDGSSVDLPEGHRIEFAEIPVRRAAIYVPGGRAPYPSSVVMGAITARTAGVREVAVSAPPGPGGRAHPVILAACLLCGVSEVYRMGGAQAIAALAYGTESVEPVDVIAGPGNAYVQEAKRQVAWVDVGIDGVAGPSELAVVAFGAGIDHELVALDLLAQAEHGPDSLLWLIAQKATGEAVTREIERLKPERPSVTEAEVAVIGAGHALKGIEIANQIAPEHLELVGDEAERFPDKVRSAGAVFIGPGAATAFGDYVAGSNHVLPTGGAARFQSALSPTTFRRRMARVSLPGEAPARLAPAGAALARAEGFPVHAESMERRA
jgi:histidinol dehydrogenase